MDKYYDNDYTTKKYTDLNTGNPDAQTEVQAAAEKISPDTNTQVKADKVLPEVNAHAEVDKMLPDTEYQYTSGPNPGQFVVTPETKPADLYAAQTQQHESLHTGTAEATQIQPQRPAGNDDPVISFDDDFGTENSYGFERLDFGSNSYDNNYGYGGFAGGGNGGNDDGQPPEKGKRRRKKREPKPVTLTRSSLAAIIIICVFLSSTFGFGGAMLANNMVTPASDSGLKSTSNAKTTGFDLEDATGSEMTVQEITAATLDSVVEIRTESVEMDSWMGQYVTEGAGSGVIIKENGYIITNNHVVEGASNIIVTTTDEQEYEATVVGTDSDTDVAVLKINAKNLKAATMGNSDQLNVGDLAVAIGNPLGELGGTVTAGIISALDRSISIDGKTMTLLQTDTSINPGNSGGGLFNQYGQLIGIVVAKSSGSDVEGLGFAIPINRAAEVASQLMDGGYVKGKPSTGMAYQDLSQQSSSDSYGFGDYFGGGYSQQSGVYIAEVNGKNAKKAGFEVGDMVYSVDGEEIDCFDTLSSIITSHQVGDKVTYVVLRDGQALEIQLELEEKTE